MPIQSQQDYSHATMDRWLNRKAGVNIKITMFIDQVVKRKRLTVSQRVKVAGTLLRDAVVANLSRPVRKVKTTSTVSTPGGGKTRKSRTVVDPESRSKPGEYPRADTTRLMKSIFHKHDESTVTSYVGTPLDYGLVLETVLDRSFLRQTMNEMRLKILLIVRG